MARGVLTNEQLLQVIAAVAGEIIGRAVSPEFFIPVAVAAYYARTKIHVLFCSAICALIGTLIFLALFKRPDYAGVEFLLRYFGSFLIIRLVFAIKSLRRKEDRIEQPDSTQSSGSGRANGGLKRFLFSRPRWLKHEGAWRVMQVFRFGVPVLLFYGFAVSTGNMRVPDWDGFLVAILVIVPASFIGVHYLFRLAKWIQAGFSEVERS